MRISDVMSDDFDFSNMYVVRWREHQAELTRMGVARFYERGGKYTIASVIDIENQYATSFIDVNADDYQEFEIVRVALAASELELARM